MSLLPGDGIGPIREDEERERPETVLGQLAVGIDGRPEDGADARAGYHILRPMGGQPIFGRFARTREAKERRRK